MLRTWTLIIVTASLFGCSAAGSPQTPAAAKLANTYWQVITIFGAPAKIGAGERELSLLLKSGDNRFHGYAGCNNYMGTYRLDPPQLSFGEIAVTRKMCVKTMEQERQFLAALAKTVSYRIEGDALTLMGEDQHPVARFRAQYLK